MDRQGRTWKNAEVGDRCGGTRDRLGRTGDPEGVGEDFGSAGNYAMEGLAWEKEDALAVRAGDIIEVLNPDARRVSVLDPKVGEVGFRDRVDLEDHSVVRGSLEWSDHGRRWDDKVILRFVLSFALHLGYELYQLDIDTAFLYGNRKETIYMIQPEGFDDGFEISREENGTFGSHIS